LLIFLDDEQAEKINSAVITAILEKRDVICNRFVSCKGIELLSFSFDLPSYFGYSFSALMFSKIVFRKAI